MAECAARHPLVFQEWVDLLHLSGVQSTDQVLSVYERRRAKYEAEHGELPGR